MVLGFGLPADTLLRYLKNFSMSIVGSVCFVFFCHTSCLSCSRVLYDYSRFANGKHFGLNWAGDSNYDETKEKNGNVVEVLSVYVTRIRSSSFSLMKFGIFTLLCDSD